MEPLLPPNGIPLASASLEQTSEGLENRGPASQATSNMMGIAVRSIIPRQQEISTIDHVMQLIGNPIQTLSAVQDQLLSNGSTSLLTASTLAPNELIKSHNHLAELSENLRNIEQTLAHPSINHNLPEYNRCTTLLDETLTALSATLVILERKNSSLESYQMSLGNLSTLFSNLTTVLHDLTEANRRRTEEPQTDHAIEPPTPGAYSISESEASMQGSFLATDASNVRRIETPEATPLQTTTGTLLDSKKEKKLATLQKKIPVVEAEIPMSMVHGLPVAEAAIQDSNIL